jgi:hypothetical protein
MDFAPWLNIPRYTYGSWALLSPWATEASGVVAADKEDFSFLFGCFSCLSQIRLQSRTPARDRGPMLPLDRSRCPPTLPHKFPCPKAARENRAQRHRNAKATFQEEFKVKPKDLASFSELPSQAGMWGCRPVPQTFSFPRQVSLPSHSGRSPFGFAVQDRFCSYPTILASPQA